MKEKTSAEWMDVYLANGNVCADVIQTTQDALRHRQLLAIERRRRDRRSRGSARCCRSGRSRRSPARPPSCGPAPEPGEHTDEVLGRGVTPVAVPPAHTGTARRPARRHHDRRGRLLLRDAVRDRAARRARRARHQDRADQRRPVPAARARRRRPGRRARAQQHGPRHAGQGVDRAQPEGRAGPGDHPPARRRRRPLRAQLPRPGARVARHRRADAARDQARSRVPVRGVVRIASGRTRGSRRSTR